MHAVVKDILEQYLSGALEPGEQRTVEAHLAVCPSCCGEIEEMRGVSRLVGALRPDEVWDPPPGFYSAVMRRVAEGQANRSFAGLFALDLALGRRLALASLMILAVVGGYLVSHETGSPQGPFPEAVIAQQDSPAFDSVAAPDAMLATLTAYVR
jgi:anti-sigma factor RsiW